jgi:hypothetical protein
MQVGQMAIGQLTIGQMVIGQLTLHPKFMKIVVRNCLKASKEFSIYMFLKILTKYIDFNN